MPILLLLALTAVEILLLIEVGGWIGFWPTLGSVFATAIIGGMILRRQGLSTLALAREHIDRREIPVAQMLDGMALFVTALFLLTPGYITDFFGFILLVPRLRHFLLRRAIRYFELRVAGTRVHPKQRPDSRVIDGDFEDVTPPDNQTRQGKDDRLPPSTGR